MLILISRAAAAADVSVSELRQALTHYQKIERLDVDFKQTKHLSDLAMDLESTGHLSLSPPDHVEWRILKPEPIRVELQAGRITIHGAGGTETYNSADAKDKDRRRMESMLNWLK